MSTSTPVAPAPKTPPTETSNTLAYRRTRMAQERTMMAWTRTGVSLISFGFSIYKVSDILQSQSGRQRIFGPQAYGSAMILTGLIALACALIQQRADLQAWRAKGVRIPPSLAGLVTLAVTLLGIFALGLVIFRQ